VLRAACLVVVVVVVVVVVGGRGASRNSSSFFFPLKEKGHIELRDIRTHSYLLVEKRTKEGRSLIHSLGSPPFLPAIAK
jgi:hypothetical protein